MFRRVVRAGFPYYVFDELKAVDGLVHAVTSRETDQADPSLDGEESAAPRKDGFLRVLGIDHVVQLRQIHSDRVRTEREAAADQRGDGLILTRAGAFGVIQTADCVPLLLLLPDHESVALIHAGWRGGAQRIAEKGVRRMLERTGARASEVIAAVGPCIRACCYRVGPAVVAAFAEGGHDVARIHREGRLDLVAAVRWQLETVGVGRILDSGVCTSCRVEDFYSWRARRDRGRMWLLAGFARKSGNSGRP